MPSERTLRKILIGLLYLAPISIVLFSRHTVFSFVAVKLFVFQVCVEILAVCWLILIIRHPQYRPRLSPLLIALLSLVLILAVAGFLGENPARSLWSTQARGVGVFALVHFLLLFLVLRSFAERFNWHRYFSFLFWIGSASGLLLIVARLAPKLFTILTPGSFLGGPSFLAALLLFTIFLGGYLAASEKTKFKYYVFAGVAVQVVALILTQTRGALLGLMSGAVILLLLSKKKKIVLSSLAVLVGLSLLIFTTRTAPLWRSVPGISRFVEIPGDFSVNNRLTAWNIGLKAFRQQPILGSGPENFIGAVDEHFEPKLLRSAFSETFFDKPHNAFLEMLVSGGLLALIGYCSVLAIAAGLLYKRAPNPLRQYGLAALVAYAVQNFFLFDGLATYFILFVLLAHVDILAPPPSGGHRMKTPQWIFYPLLLLAAALAVYSVNLNIKIIYANRLHYQALSFAASDRPGESAQLFRRAISIEQPYRDEISINYLETVTEAVKRGSLTNNKEDIETALAAAQQAIRRDPNNYLWLLTLADARTILYSIDAEFLEGAQEELDRAIELSPKRQQSYYTQAKLDFLTKGIDAARVQMEKAVSIDPQSGEPYFYYGLLEGQVGDLQKGIDKFEKARELNRSPHTFEEYKLVAGYYADTTHYDRAQEYYKKALTFDPGDTDLRLRLGLVYYYANKFDEAKKQLEPIVPAVLSSPSFEQLRPILIELGILGV